MAEKADVQKKAAARAKISVENAIDVVNTDPTFAKQLKDDSHDSIQKITARETEREMKHFNERAAALSAKQPTDHDVIDICSTVVKMQNKSNVGPPQGPPFREQAPNRGARSRGRGNRRGYHPYPQRGNWGGYQ